MSTHAGGYARRIIHAPHDLHNQTNGLTVIIHGWMGEYPNNVHWQMNLILRLLDAKPEADVLTVDWARGSAIVFGDDPYAQPASNVRSIAVAVGNLLKNGPGFDLTKAHCIGLGPGAHVCGFIAKHLSKRWSRITGLDPAYPYFDWDNPTTRLDKSDGDFVDIIHTSRLGLERPIGHADFYINGGAYQPGCAVANIRRRRHGVLATFVKQFTLAIEELFACSHIRAALLYAETVWNPPGGTGVCTFTTFCPCFSVVDYNRGSCSICESPVTMGYWADSKVHGTFYGTTTEEAPYCNFESDI